MRSGGSRACSSVLSKPSSSYVSNASRDVCGPGLYLGKFALLVTSSPVLCILTGCNADSTCARAFFFTSSLSLRIILQNGSAVLGCTRTRTQADTGRHRQTQADTGRHRQTQADTGRHRQTQANTGRRRQTQADTGKHRQTHSNGISK
jgi:hypothetical protein